MNETLYGLTKQEWDALVEYDPFDGGLIWKERPVTMFTTPNRQKAWNKRYANKPAGGWNTWKGKTYRKLRWGDKKLRVCNLQYAVLLKPTYLVTVAKFQVQTQIHLIQLFDYLFGYLSSMLLVESLDHARY